MANTYGIDRSDLPAFSYANKDYNSILQALMDAIPNITERWTDMNPTDHGIVLLELSTFGLDMLAYYLDVYAREAYLDTVLIRENLFRLTELISYAPRKAAGGTTELKITLERPATSGVTLPKFWQARNGYNVPQYYLALAEEAEIPAGQTTVTANAIQGKKSTASATGDGTAGQTIDLPEEKACSATMTVDSVEWTEVSTLVGQASTAMVFTFKLLHDGTCRIATGDGVEGALIPSGAAVEIEYLVTLGTGGNIIGSGIIVDPADAVYDGAVNITADVITENLSTISGGTDAETSDSIKRNAPRVLHTLFRMVAANDIKSLLEAYAGVQRVQVVDKNNHDAFIRYHYVEVYIVPTGGGTPTQALLDDLDAYIDDKRVICTELRLLPASYVTIDVEIDIYRYSSYSEAAVAQSVQETIQDYLSLDPNTGQTDWQTDFDRDHLLAEIDRTAGVSSAEFVTPTADVEIGVGEIPKLGTLTVNMK